jgi:hypothetical protein
VSGPLPPPMSAKRIKELARTQTGIPRPRYVGNRGAIGGSYTAIGTGGQAGNYVSRARQAFVAGADLGGVQVEWANVQFNAGAASTSLNAITITASVEYPSGTIAATMTFNGSASGSCPVNGTLLSDLAQVYIPAGATAFIRTYAVVTSGQVIPASFLPITALGEYNATGTNTLTDHTTSAATNSTGSATAGFGYQAVHGLSCDAGAAAVALINDSLGWGRGDHADGTNATPTGDGLGNFGPFQRALSAAGIGHARINKSGLLARDIVASSTNRAWKNLVRGATTAIVQLGTNDIGTNVGYATLQSYLMEIYTWCACQGVRVVPCTLPPRASAGTNTVALTPSSLTNGFGVTSWATSDLKAINDWIRSLPTTLPYVPGVIDGYSAVASTVDPRLWKTNDATTRWQTDGTHWAIANASTTGGIEVVRDLTTAAIARGVIY